MNCSINNKQTYLKSALKQQIDADMQVGVALSADPTNANLPDLVLRTTTINSLWFGQTCRICKDKFREDDLVRLCPSCNEPFHDDNQYSLACWQKNFAAGAICKEGTFDDRFSQNGRGLKRCEFSLTYPSAADRHLTFSQEEKHLQEEKHSHGSPAVLLVRQFVAGIEMMWRPFGEMQSIKIPTGSLLVGRKCPWCRFSVRVGDWVVACPCESNCGTYFHQDIFHHLTCWNGWNGVEGNDFCPNTGAEYPASAKKKKEG